MITKAKLIALVSISLSCSLEISAQQTSIKNLDFKVDSLLSKMTLDEKIGQLNQQNVDFATGTTDNKFNPETVEDIKSGRIGSFLNSTNLDKKIQLQQIAVEQSRLRIPLLFALDVVHGYRTIFPLPLAQSCSWDLGAIKNAERIAATEASADGVHWTFAPMVDVGRDPRWGRVMEGSGEDTWLGTQIAKARLSGFQGDDLSKNNTIMACAKHFAGYGDGEAAREYNSVEMSERQLREIYLPPFQALVDGGVGSVMNAFHSLDGIPCSGNKHLVKDILRDEWNFKGLVVSDYESISEMTNHGFAKDGKHAAEIAMNTRSSDIDMVSQVFLKNLKKLVQEGKVKESYINDACSRVLKMKFALGLFEDPYRYFNKERSKALIYTKENIEASRDLARKSMVLLKNEGNLLPISKKVKTIAVIGPMADAHHKKDYLSFWTFMGQQNDVVTLVDGIKAKLGDGTKILTDSVCGWMGDCKAESIKNAVKLAQSADIVIMALGENGERNGESRTRTNLDLPGNQKELEKAILATGKPVVAVLFNGRPLTLEWESRNIPAILEAWQPGSQAGNAVADVLFGDYNPSAKLTMSFPLNVGQIPVYYNSLPTGRPSDKQGEMWKSTFADISNFPLYPFGFGLSYTNFEYSDFSLNKTSILGSNDVLEATITITNNGPRDGEEIVQLYTRDLIGEVSRPVKELKGFEKVSLKKGESKKVIFKITEKDLKYWHPDLTFRADKGDFKIMIGPNSMNVKEKTFQLE